ncbi:MAG: hypothetical protein LIQ31_01555 [Planctomycetes bacterium]|nr:hypothetical protein [Planctomycetota bacterium]
MLRVRLILVSLFFVVMFAGAVYRLVDLQFNRSAELAAYRDRRLSHIEQKMPRRGRILDATGAIIAEDQPTQDLWITPARTERVNRRRTVVSLLPPLTADQMLAIAAARGEARDFEKNVAITALAEGNPLVAALAERLKMPREEVADKILAGILSGRPGSRDDLVYPRPVLDNIAFALGLEIRAARANPFDDELWDPAVIRTGGRRVYPAGAVVGHITGTVGQLTAEEYDELRGHWEDDHMVPGKGVLTKQGRVFFSILGGDDGEPISDEELIIRLREIKRNGRMIKTQGYFANETVGRGGVEQHYNQALRGRHRLQRLRLTRDETSGRRRFEPKGEVERAENGPDIRLSFKMDVQRQAYEIMDRHIKQVAKRPELIRSGWTQSGVAILMDPNNGRIHALVSIPSYDPNTFNRDFAKLADDPRLPLVDRAIAGIYPPGSVVKPIVGLAGLTENVIMPGQKFHCDRVMYLGGARFTCLGRHGDQDLETALMNSCNMYFYHTGELLGGRRLYEWYTRMGLGHRTGIDIAGEKGGILPRNAYTRRGWATGNTYHMSIGQGIAVTPLQIAVSFAALANARGDVMRIVRPHLLIPPPTPPENGVEAELAREAMALDQPLSEIQIDREALAVVRQGLWETVQGKPETGQLGTGQLAAFPDSHGGYLLEVAGKTGTAEWSRVVGGRVRKQISHVWFAGYAPFDRPEVVVVVFLPEAGHGGGSTCAPIAKDLLRMWFNLPDRMEVLKEEEGALG